MNKKERREFEQFKEKMSEAKNQPQYKIMKEIEDSLRGSGTNVEEMKEMLLAYQANPEPIQILFTSKNKSTFANSAYHKFMPCVCYEQELNGSFSKVIGNGTDFSSSISELEESTKKRFPLKNLSQNCLNIETIKILNSIYESHGGIAMDVFHYIFTDLPMEKVLEQTKDFEIYFKETYKGLRNICVKAIIPLHDEKAGG